MNKKTFTFLITALMISMSASSQTIRDNIEKAINDKDAKERSAKADVIIHKKIITDSTVRKGAPTKVASKTPSKIKHKKHKYKRKYKTSTK